MTIKKTVSIFGKKNINKIKQTFIDNNSQLVMESKKTFSQISKIGFVNTCNVCSSTLDDVCFSKHGIQYYRCDCCGMLGTGKIANYDNYNSLLYQEESYGDYTGFESERLNDIYVPKVEYLIKTLPDVFSRGVIDIGAGLGYFVKALSLKGIEAKGYEINKEFVKRFNRIEEKSDLKGKLINVAHDKLIDALKCENNDQVISLIGVLEHVEDPLSLLDEIKKMGFRHIFVSVPMFGMSTYFEAALDNYYHRQLSPDHIYLYTDQTLSWLERRLEFDRISEWFFGQDMYDISRILASNETGFSVADSLEMFEQMQLVIDKNRLSSEIHLIWSC